MMRNAEYIKNVTYLWQNEQSVLCPIRQLCDGSCNKPMMGSWFERMINQIGDERRAKLENLVSSREYWTICESGIQWIQQMMKAEVVKSKKKRKEEI